ncbi:MAG TPA: dUTP diphosphatase [Ignavibacteria bacterium]|nr:dUTP diphosphatase [Ignavibacteria bacterium]
MNLKIKRINQEIKNPFPEYKTEHSAGMDLTSAEKTVLKKGESKLIGTNFIIELEDGYEAQVRPRSGLALKNKITVLNSPGTIDADYRGEVKVLLINFGEADFEINIGDRIAQIIISKYSKAKIIEVTELTETVRGSGGYGSTGLK